MRLRNYFSLFFIPFILFVFGCQEAVEDDSESERTFTRLPLVSLTGIPMSTGTGAVPDDIMESDIVLYDILDIFYLTQYELNPSSRSRSTHGYYNYANEWVYSENVYNLADLTNFFGDPLGSGTVTVNGSTWETGSGDPWDTYSHPRNAELLTDESFIIDLDQVDLGEGRIYSGVIKYRLWMGHTLVDVVNDSDEGIYSGSEIFHYLCSLRGAFSVSGAELSARVVFNLDIDSTMTTDVAQDNTDPDYLPTLVHNSYGGSISFYPNDSDDGYTFEFDQDNDILNVLIGLYSNVMYYFD